MFQKLLQNTETMADLLGQTMPELPIEGEIFVDEEMEIKFVLLNEKVISSFILNSYDNIGQILKMVENKNSAIRSYCNPRWKIFSKS
jgi:hypothetical protein